MFGIPKKLNLREMKNPLYFVALSIILTISFFLLFSSYFQLYRTEISILLVSKSEKAFLQTGQILENLSELPRQLSFYERLLQNSEIPDPYSGKTQDRRKELWNKNLQIQSGKNGSIITLGVDAKKRSESVYISKLATNTLFSSASKYYDVKKDIDLRIIDGPITRPVIKNMPGLVLISLALGVALAYLINIILLSITGFVSEAGQKLARRNISVKREALFPKLPNFDKNPLFTKKSPAAGKQYGAPANLPIATGQYPFAGETSVQIGTEAENKNSQPENLPVQQSQAADSLKNGEPTEEELKRRLNQLIRGDF